MKTPKKVIQDWLGITNLAKKIVELDSRLTNLDHYGAAGFNNITYRGIPVEIRDDVPENMLYMVNMNETKLKKGYDKPQS